MIIQTISAVTSSTTYPAPVLYPTGQNYSLELMFAKFAIAKNREKLNPLKLISNRC